MTVEIPTGDSQVEVKDTGEEHFANSSSTTDQSVPEAATARVNNTATEKGDASEGKKTARSQRNVLIGGILLIVVAIAVILAIVLAVVVQPRKNKETYSNSNSNSTSVQEAAGPTLTITDNPFDTELPLVSAANSNSNINTEPYISIEDARNDIEQLAKSIVNKIIVVEANKNDDLRYNNWDDRGGGFVMESEPMMSADMNVAAARAPSASASSAAKGVSESSGSVFEGADDFETYQHEKGAVKSDLVKSNGRHVFAAVEDRILVWDLDGILSKTITLPSIKTAADEPETSKQAQQGSKQKRSSMFWSPKPHIQALLMNPDGTKLIVVAGGYGNEYKPTFSERDVIRLPIIQNYMETRVIIYDIDESVLTELSQSTMNGYHVDSYMVGSNLHVVTKMTVNTWEYLSRPLQRWTFEDMTSDEYVAAATLKAEEILPEFVINLVDLVSDEEDNVALTRLSAFVDPSADPISDYSTMTQVNSIDTNNIIGSEIDDMSLNVSKSLVLQSGNTGYVYATDEWIWVTDQSWAWNLEKGEYMEQTRLLGFRLDGATSTFGVIGSVPGSLLSQFSIDFVTDKDKDKEYIRIATTQNLFQRGWWGAPVPVVMPDIFRVDEDEEVEDEEVAEESSTFEAKEDPMDESRTKNEIIILEIPNVEDSNELIKLGSVRLGKKDETITAVRFFDNISYVVTFERTDPFYVLDLSDPMDPQVLGELEIPGFSEFMHPIKEDNAMLITVGKAADENGRVLGLQISLFDSTVPTDPKLIDRLVIEDDKDSSSGSSASWDERAFRYIQVGDIGRLIIPVSIYSYGSNFFENENFEGFMVFGVDLTKTENMITQEIKINHWQNEEEDYYTTGSLSCYCGYTWLPERSMVFDGNLMTLKNQEVMSTNLVTHESQWNLTLKDDDNCCNP